MAYFEGYSAEDIHAEMLSDKRRTEAFKKAIKDSVAGKLVIDVGAGTGILSVFAAEAGAKKVFPIENAQIFHTCKETIA